MKRLSKIYHFLKSFIMFPYNIYRINIELNKINRSDKTLNQKISDLELSMNTKIDSNKILILNKADEISIENKSMIENQFLQIESLLSIYSALPNIKYLPATRGWAGSPDFLNKIMEVILKQKPRFVVEASSGVSSIIIGLALKMNKYGKSLSLEHDTTYTESTRKNIEINQIKDISSLFNCPLVEYVIENEKWKWYEINRLNITEKIDLLIVDGPPRMTQSLARYPVIPILFQYFSENFIVLLDDAKRPDEIIIVEKWVEFLKMEGCSFNIEHYLNYEKGMVLLHVRKGKKLNEA